MFFYVVGWVGGGEDFGFVYVVYAYCFEDLERLGVWLVVESLTEGRDIGGLIWREDIPDTQQNDQFSPWP